MKKQFGGKRKTLRNILILAVVVVAGIAATINAFSLWQSDNSVHINPKEIPASTLAIGTHLVHLKSLTNIHYEAAMASATESNQSNIYYKSELADGTWFDITAGSSIGDITTGDNDVDDSVIEALFFDYHTKEDGITYDLRTGKAVNIFDIINPYDLMALPELAPLKNAYDSEKETGKNSRKLNFMELVLKADVKDEETDELDRYMAALDGYYKILNENNGTQANKETVMAVQQSVDSSRRILVLTQVGLLLDGSLKSIMENKAKYIYDEEGNLIETIPAVNAPELKQPAEDSKTNVETSILDYMGKALAEGASIISQMRYEFQMSLIKDADAQNHSQCDEDVANIQALDNIVSGRIVDREREASILDSKLIPAAEAAFEQGKDSGENQEYQTAVANNSSSVIVERVVNDYYNKLFSQASELETYLDAKCRRMGNSAAQSFIQEKLDKANTYYNTIPSGAFSAKANQAVQEYIIWLENKMAFLVSAAGGTQGDVLAQKKEALTEEYLAALDNNDLVGAKAIMEEINNIAAQIAELGDVSPEGWLVKQYTNEAISLINDSETGSSSTDPNLQKIGDILDSLNAMMGGNYKTAFPAVQKISDAMKAQKYGAGLGVGTIGSAGSGSGSGNGSGSGTGTDSGGSSGNAGDSEGTAGSGSGNGSGSGGTGASASAATSNKFDGLIDKAGSIMMENQGMYEAGTLGVKDPKEMDAIIQDYLDGLDEFGEHGKALIKISALNKLLMTIPGNRYYEDILAIMNNTAVMESVKGNPYVFAKMKTMEGVYAPITAVSAKSGLRYVWYLSKDNGVLAKGAERYEFTAFSKQVIKNNVAVNMSLPALVQKVLYLPAGYINSEWGYVTVNLTNCEYGILIDVDIDKKAAELMGLLQN